MLFSKIIVVLGVVATASAHIIPSKVLKNKLAKKTHPEKRTITGNFNLKVVGGSHNGEWLLGKFDTTGAFGPGPVDVVECWLGIGGRLECTAAIPGVLGWDDLAWAFFDNTSAEITGCSFNGTDFLVGCTATYDGNTYDRFGTAEDGEVWAMGNESTDWGVYGGEEIFFQGFNA
ncbi:uncharacterized protein DFL_001435 [Arthrobotrys flagrans]|uniref:Cyanovirin-N domain-containing protein n=1 Tax=Arthrobotrys flagrans TaxID=97331 RepID=A0A437A7S6_ARTFL|nr:hypothetical protein DFL_001435 [Arthrobotrys flagrans]